MGSDANVLEKMMTRYALAGSLRFAFGIYLGWNFFFGPPDPVANKWKGVKRQKSSRQGGTGRLEVTME